MRFPVLTALVAAATLSGCATSRPKAPAPVPPVARKSHAHVPKSRATRPACGALCDQIAACALRQGRAEYQDLLCEIARCETGDKCTSALNSPTGRYRGPFQFSRATWRSQCGPIFARKGLTSCRSPRAMHDVCCATACAAEIIAFDGPGSWPTCGKRALDLTGG